MGHQNGLKHSHSPSTAVTHPISLAHTVPLSQLLPSQLKLQHAEDNIPTWEGSSCAATAQFSCSCAQRLVNQKQDRFLYCTASAIPPLAAYSCTTPSSNASFLTVSQEVKNILLFKTQQVLQTHQGCHSLESEWEMTRFMAHRNNKVMERPLFTAWNTRRRVPSPWWNPGGLFVIKHISFKGIP